MHLYTHTKNLPQHSVTWLSLLKGAVEEQERVWVICASLSYKSSKLWRTNGEHGDYNS